jgi:TolB-like protein/Tfp pilus assembly protein PilF
MISPGAVFLSYASEDAPAAQRIAEALRAAGVEVWFDRSELRGGDTWDRKIQDQVHQCRLFIPIISANTERRDEGYYRREWRLAVERSGDMAERKAFLVPVAIDDTPERGASVPDKFRHVQWTRLPGGETSPAFVDRIRLLLSSDVSPPPQSITSPPASASAPSSRRTPVRLGRALLLAVGLAGLGVSYVAVERWLPSSRPTPSVPDPSIAVLPFANEGGDASQLYFADGLSQDLITALSQFSGLKVIGRTSSFQFRDSKDDSKTIGVKLGVAHLLEGSVRHAGDVVRVSAELINAADGSTQWSERYDRPYKDLFALQDEVTRAVAGALQAKLVSDEVAAARSEHPPSGSLDAYNAMLEGRFYGSRETEGDIRKAIESFTQATQFDPRFALAWSELSQAFNNLATVFQDGAAARETYAKARDAAERALVLSPKLAGAHLARGAVLQNADFDWGGAESEFRRAMELAPNESQPKVYLGNQLATRGEVKAAIELTQQAITTDPLRSYSYNWLGVYLTALDRLDEAERAVRRAITLQPGAAGHFVTLAIIEIKRGHPQAALDAAQQESTEGGWQDIAFALARQISADRGAADAALQVLIKKEANGSAYQIAQVYALRNDDHGTFEWLDRAWSTRDTGIGYLLFDPFILRYKDDPRFAAFCRKVGLPTPAEVAHGT